jgi:hypothetical protein
MYIVSVAVVLVSFCYLFHIQVTKNPLRYDEVDYFQCMQNVVELGLPIYYAGEVDLDYSRLVHLSTRYLDGRRFEFYRFKPETGVLKEAFFAITDGSSRYTFGMWHPPLYIYLGSLFFRLVPLTPENSSLLRYFNLVFTIGMFVGVVALSRELYPKDHRRVFLIALVMYTLNSLAIRGSTLIDYNATLGPCVATWFVWACLRSLRGARFYVGLSIFTGLALFTGLGIAASLLLGVFFYLCAFGRHWRPWRLVVSLLLGTLGFLLGFLILCQFLQIPFVQPFLHNFQRVSVQVAPNGIVRQALVAFTYTYKYAKEIGLANISLAIMLLAVTLLSRKVRVTLDRAFLPVMIFVGLVSQAGLGAEAYGFMKYILFLLPLFFVYVAGEAVYVQTALAGMWKNVILVAFAGVAVASAVHSFEITNRPGNTLYIGGEQGIMAVSRVLKESAARDDVVLCQKDVGFFADRKFIGWSGRYLTDVMLVRDRVEQQNIKYAVNSLNMLSAASGDVDDYLEETFLIQYQAGDFVLMERKEP